MKKLKTLDIGEVAKQSGLPVSTLRFYEERGLIRSTGRSGLRRLFDSSVIEQLALIALGRTAGFSLKEIASMFAPKGRIQINRKQLLSKAEELDRSIKRLTAARDGLRHVAHCPSPSQLECPKFQRLLRVAGRTEAFY
jgi:DNA-binding transcriptional MerR regulator